MVDFKIPDLCGASPELNDVLSKLADAKADAKAKLDEALHLLLQRCVWRSSE